MLESTSEPFLPTIQDVANTYMRLHRYIYASQFVAGKRVLDLGAGDSLGDAILAESAAAVTTRLLPGTDLRFDVIVHFDITESSDQDALLQEVKRLLENDGVFMVSAPAQAQDQFHQLLSRRFQNVEILGQGVYANSSIWPTATANGTSSQVVTAHNEGEAFRLVPAEQRTPLSFIAIASDAVLSRPHESVFVDEANRLIRDEEKTISELIQNKTYQTGLLKWHENLLAERRETLASLQEAFAWHKSQIESLTKSRTYLESEIDQLRKTIASNEQALAWRTAQADDFDAEIDQLKKSIAWLQQTIASLEQSTAWLQQTIASLEQSTAWLQQKVAEREQSVEWLKQSIASKDETIASHEQALLWRAFQVEKLEEGLAKTTSQLSGVSRQLDEASQELAAIHASRGWKLILRLRSIRDRFRKR